VLTHPNIAALVLPSLPQAVKREERNIEHRILNVQYPSSATSFFTSSFEVQNSVFDIISIAFFLPLSAAGEERSTSVA
jgi:hypothetical protein